MSYNIANYLNFCNLFAKSQNRDYTYILMKSKVSVVIVAAGESRRFGKKDKLLIKINQKPLVIYTLNCFEKNKKVDNIVLVVRKNKITKYKNLVNDYNMKKVKRIIPGGSTRQISSFCGLKALDKDTEVVLIHDGARPYVSDKLINNVIENTLKFGAVVPVLPVKETLKIVKDNYILSTFPRENIFFAQTPQGFKYEVILKAYRMNKNKYFTDDAQLLEKTKNKIKVIKGEYQNIKITTPEDLRYDWFPK